MYDRDWPKEVLEEFSNHGIIFDFSWYFDKRRKEDHEKGKYFYWPTKPSMVRYAPCDYALWCDFDIQITKPLDGLLEEFIDSGKEYGISGYFNGDYNKKTRDRFANSGIHLAIPYSDFSVGFNSFVEKTYKSERRDEQLLFHYVNRNQKHKEMYRYDSYVWCTDFEVVHKSRSSEIKIKYGNLLKNEVLPTASIHWCGKGNKNHFFGRYKEIKELDFSMENKTHHKLDFGVIDKELGALGLTSDLVVNVVGAKSRCAFGRMLYSCGLNGVGVELGVGDGVFSKFLLDESPLQKLISVDLWKPAEYLGGKPDPTIVKTVEDGDKKFRTVSSMLNKFFGSRSEVWRCESAQAATKIKNGTLDFIFIDASPDYKNVLKYLIDWYPKIKNGGIISGHDFVDGRHFGVQFGVKSAVEFFFSRIGKTIYRINEENGFPSWFVIADGETTDLKKIVPHTNVEKNDITVKKATDRESIKKILAGITRSPQIA
jgi:hypothetical protein